MHIAYTGNFKDLKPMGYKFLRLYAANYICYRKEDVWIWKKGKDIEIADLYSSSYLVLEYLIKNNFKINNEYNIIIVNDDTKQIEEYHREKHEPFFLFGTLSDEKMNKFYRTIKKIKLSEETINVLKELYKNNLIKIENEIN